MRVAEHYTIGGGKIRRIRQVHDTAALRAAGFVGTGDDPPPDVSGAGPSSVAP